MKVNETINVPLWELKEIANTLRMVANALDCPKRESCLDRNVMRSWNNEEILRNVIDKILKIIVGQ